ncbi:MAG: hypothetical protein ABIF77_06780 [bacterium]
MRIPFVCQRRRKQRRPRQINGPMARSRRLIGRRILLILLGSGTVTWMLVLLVALANNVINLRLDISQYHSDRECLEARVAEHLAQWNEQSALEVVTARAAAELGLIHEAENSQVIVVVDQNREAEESQLLRFLEQFGAGSQAQAAFARDRNP